MKAALLNLRQTFFQKPAVFKLIMNVWPPFLGAGIRVHHVAADYSEIVVQLRDTRVNRNAFGTHFGGSLYGMTDAFIALMLASRLGADYFVWDRAARIDFLKPGRGTVTARFTLSEAQIEEARARTAGGAKYQPEFEVDIVDAAGEVIARVHKTLYVRRKPSRRPKAQDYG